MNKNPNCNVCGLKMHIEEKTEKAVTYGCWRCGNKKTRGR